MSDRRRGDGAEKGMAALPNLADFAAPDLMKFTANVVSTWSQLNGQLMSMAQTSLQNNLAAAEELRQVQSPKDLLDIQMRVARKAYEDYMDEAAKIGQLVQKLSADTIETFSPGKSA